MSKDGRLQSHLKALETGGDNDVDKSHQFSGCDFTKQESCNSGSHHDEGTEDANLRNIEANATTKVKDAGKRKRASKTAKLKQCKLDARQKQWLSSVNAGGRKQDDAGNAGIRKQGAATPASTVAGARGNGTLESVADETDRRDSGTAAVLDSGDGKHGGGASDCQRKSAESESNAWEGRVQAAVADEGASCSPCFSTGDSAAEAGKVPPPFRDSDVDRGLTPMLAGTVEEGRSPLNLSREMLERTELAREPISERALSSFRREGRGKATNLECCGEDLDAVRESFQKLDPTTNGPHCPRGKLNGARNGSHAGAGRNQGPGLSNGKRGGGMDASLSSCTESCGGSTSTSSCANSCAGSSGAGSGSDDNDEPAQRNGHHRSFGFGQGSKGDSEVDDWEALYVVPEENEKQPDVPPSDHHPAEENGEEEFEGKGSGMTSLDATTPRDVSLKPDYKYHGSAVGSQMRSQGPPRAWRPDDMSRPPTLPRLAKQHSYPLHTAAPWGGAFNGSVWGLQPPPPEYCPVCTEEMDTTDASFLPCSCGFRICLFCHHRIVLGDGRCPGCRKAYATAEVKLSRSPSLWLRPNRGAALLS